MILLLEQTETKDHVKQQTKDHDTRLQSLLKKLFDEPQNEGATCLYVSCQENQLACVEFLVAIKADLNRPTDRGFTPVEIAVLKGNEDIVEHLLQAGAAIKRAGEPAQKGASRPRTTPLLLAAQQKSLNAVKLLLKANADPNEVSQKGCSPLIKACQKNCIDIAATLMDHGALVDHAAADGATSLQQPGL
ncbi:ANK1 [Symbiodinium natans]|uniref:ANK1 protein n=1 Tax=Symbiodinium natans TaxID=878477 RepID=A0A812T678_9DINO|nr:ANK1 [Symbiodinium natans]